MCVRSCMGACMVVRSLPNDPKISNLEVSIDIPWYVHGELLRGASVDTKVPDAQVPYRK